MTREADNAALMPLKHFTETVLVVILGVAVILTGILVPTLPPLPQGILPWMILFFLALAYPLGLYPLLRNNRADYAFRLLHFLPAALLVIWLGLQIAVLQVPTAVHWLHAFVFGWTLSGVIVSFLLIAAFVLHVIRRRIPRLVFLGILLVPFLVFSLLAQRSTHGNPRLASVLWHGTWWNIIATEGSSSSIAFAPSSSSTGNQSSHAALPPPPSRSSSSRPLFVQASSSSKPSHLPSAGPEFDLLVLTVLALSSARWHRRLARRIDNC